MKNKIILSLLLIFIVGCSNYDSRGFNEQGINKITKTTLDVNGYDKNGFDSEKFDKNGFNSFGYNRDGYNILGYNSEGYDKNGFNADGYNKDGYNNEGYDKNGYDKRGYNKFNRDINGYSEAQLNIFKKFTLEPIDSFNYVINMMKESENYTPSNKSEFESLEDYNKRISQENREFREKKLKDEFIFITGDNINATYDVDKGALKVVLGDYNHEERNFDKNYTYDLKNNNGNKVQVAQVKREEKDYIIDNVNEELYIPMSADEAKEIKKKGLQVELLVAPKYSQVEKISHETKYYETIDSFYALTAKTYPAIAFRLTSSGKEIYKHAKFSSGYIAYDVFNEKSKEYEPELIMPNLDVKRISKNEYFRYRIKNNSLYVIKRIDDYYQEYEYVNDKGFVANNTKYNTWTDFYYNN